MVDSDHRVALAAVDLEAVHLVPEQLGGERVLAEDDRGELGEAQAGHVGPDGAGEAGHALVGADLHEVLDEAEAAVVELEAAPGGHLAAVLGVDVDRAEQALLPEAALGRHGAGDLADADLGDLHGLAASPAGASSPPPTRSSSAR
jgi:hypothetical protein